HQATPVARFAAPRAPAASPAIPSRAEPARARLPYTQPRTGRRTGFEGATARAAANRTRQPRTLLWFAPAPRKIPACAGRGEIPAGPAEAPLVRPANTGLQ